MALQWTLRLIGWMAPGFAWSTQGRPLRRRPWAGELNSFGVLTDDVDEMRHPSLTTPPIYSSQIFQSEKS
jgi:hypothetical protein